MMKYLSFCLLFVLAAFPVFSQSPGLKTVPYKKKEFRLNALKQPLVLKKNSADKFDEVKNLVEMRDQARRSHRTGLGTIYTLPIDNMPCLVPGKNNAPMPIYGEGQWPSSRMPNAAPQKKIIPQDR